MARDAEPLPRPRGLLRSTSYSMAQLHKLVHTQIEEELAVAGISLRTYQVLVCLSEFGDLSQQQVCDSVESDRSDMVRIVDQLEELGLVVRKRDLQDRRRQILKLTKSGIDAVRRSQQVIERTTEAGLARLSFSERQMLQQLMLKALGESFEDGARVVSPRQ